MSGRHHSFLSLTTMRPWRSDVQHRGKGSNVLRCLQNKRIGANDLGGALQPASTINNQGTFYVNDHNKRRYGNLLQGLGQRPGRNVLAWLASELRRMGWSNAFPRAERLPRSCT